MLAQNTISLLPEEGVICIQGPDARTFLQGQLTCDMALVTPQRSQLAAYCNRQGRMLAIMRLYCLTDDSQSQAYLLRTVHALIEPVMATFKRFGVFSNITCDDVSAHWQVAGLHINDHANACAIVLPHAIGDCISSPDYCLTRVDEEAGRYEMLYTRERDWSLDPLFKGLNPVPAQHWYCAQIIAGIGVVKSATFEKFTPHQLNLQCLGAISFTKGCYIGQEVVARMHHLGKLKQHMYYASMPIDGDAALSAGDAIIAMDEENKTVGTVVDAQALNTTCHLLMSLQDHYCTRPIAAQSIPHKQLTVHSLPVRD